MTAGERSADGWGVLNYLHTLKLSLWGLVVDRFPPDALPRWFVRRYEAQLDAWPARHPANCAKCYYGSQCSVHGVDRRVIPPPSK